MSSSPSDFVDVEATCNVLQRISLQFAEDSEEYRAISVAATALIAQITGNTRKEFEAFLASRESVHGLDEFRAEWLAKNPNAEIGTSVVIRGKLHVVTLGLDSQVHLVPIRPA